MIKPNVPPPLVCTACHKLIVDDFSLLEMHQVSQVWVIRVHQLWVGGVKTHKVVTCHLLFSPYKREAHLHHEIGTTQHTVDRPDSFSILLFHS